MFADGRLGTCHLVESNEMVTGPSLSSETFMKAPKRPSLTLSGLYSLPILATKLSHIGAALHSMTTVADDSNVKATNAWHP